MMDRAEQLALKYLTYRGFANPIHEPDGKVPPDFLLNGQIAVEVRRLNENEQGVPNPRGLSEVEIPLLNAFRRLLESYGAPSPNRWLVALRFKRPVPRWRAIEKPARSFLDAAIAANPPQRARIVLHDSVEVEVIPRTEPAEETFDLAITSDNDSGGWLLELLEQNLSLCIAEKTAKIAPVRPKYPEWWLVLVDEIAFGLSDFDREQFRSSPRIQHDWDKIILVSAADHTHYFEL